MNKIDHEFSLIKDLEIGISDYDHELYIRPLVNIEGFFYHDEAIWLEFIAFPLKLDPIIRITP